MCDPLAFDSPNKYEVFVNISQHQSDKPSETRGICFSGVISCHIRPMDQVILHNIEKNNSCEDLGVRLYLSSCDVMSCAWFFFFFMDS